MIEPQAHEARPASFRLSPMQQGMLFHYLSDGSSGVDIEQIEATLDEDVDVRSLQRAWNALLARHENLRAAFDWKEGGEPLQRTREGVEVPFRFEDWRECDEHERDARLRSYLESDRAEGFRLDCAPLMRVAVFRVAERAYKLIWTVHHILVDGRSHVLALREVFSTYEAVRDGREPRASETRPYREYVHWLENLDLAKAEDFWRSHLAGFTASTPFVVDRKQETAPGDATPHEMSYGRTESRLSPELTAALERLAADLDVTLNTLVQGAWALLLSRYSGEDDVVFGATRACRRWSDDTDDMIGLFINTLPLRVKVDEDRSLADWLRELRAQQVRLREHEHTPLAQIQSWSQVARGRHLFESILVFDYHSLDFELKSAGGEWANRSFRLHERTTYPLTLYAHRDSALALALAYTRRRFEEETIERMLGHLETLLQGMVEHSSDAVSSLPLLTPEERDQILIEWNRTGRSYPPERTVHQLIEAQVRRTPDAVAAVFEEASMTYRELDELSNRLARRLRSLGVGPEALVGVYMERSLEMLVGLLGILKAGGAYVPLDPGYPTDRLRLVVDDSGLAVLLTQPELEGNLSVPGATVVALDSSFEALRAESDKALDSGVTGNDLAYVIYTSGSTGKPKGVMISHRNVVNFFVGMDERILREEDGQGVWLAVTSISFDISVLELFWTLARGFKVVLQAEDDVAVSKPGKRASRSLDFSLFYFAADEGGDVDDKYRLLLEGARFADRHGFAAVWTPERHFHAFGGLYPNPAVVGAAIASITEHVDIRAGSVVLPLHNPLRVAEEWSVVDNLSKGRVGLSLASGWQPNDFVLAPENHADRKEIMLRGIETLRRLWRGEEIRVPGVGGKEVAVRTLPRPIQSELPVWVTAGGSPDTFRMAGEIGANLLTHLLGQSIDQVAEKIEIYREASRRRSGDRSSGHVTIMLHTFVGADREFVKNTVRKPFSDYLKTALDLVRIAPRAFPNFSLPSRPEEDVAELSAEDFTPEDMESLVAHAFDRYFETSGLFGTPESCLEKIERLEEIGVDEIACLIDFGVEVDAVLANLRHLDRLKNLSSRRSKAGDERYSVRQQIKRHGVTHLQCTPSMAKMLVLDPETHRALGTLRQLLLGGEALPESLVDHLGEGIRERLLNMYGPTETTIWSSSSRLASEGDRVSIGRPIANTELYVLDRRLRPLPVGVPGELFIGGDGLARGYWNRPELTGERFVRHPFPENGDARLYRTGDLVRYLPDGRLEFLGRLDHQVKIRGYRVELGEIESVLEKQPDVGQAVVIAREDTPGDKRLVAYITRQDRGASKVGELRAALKEKLPEFMVPSAFVVLDSFPLTPNGKVDRRALPAPDTDRPDLERPYVAPRTSLEERIARTWADVLGIDNVGVHDNFFDLGGDSILAVQIIARLNQEGIELSVRELLDHQTVAELAAEKVDAEGTEPARNGAREKVALTTYQQRILGGRPAGANRAAAGWLLGFRDSVDPAVLEAAVREVIARHEALRLRFPGQPDGEEAVVTENGLDSVFSSVELGSEDPRALGELVDETGEHLDPEKGPVFRVVHVRCEGGRECLLLLAHPAVLDGPSWRLLLEELETACRQLSRGEAVALPAARGPREYSSRLSRRLSRISSRNKKPRSTPTGDELFRFAGRSRGRNGRETRMVTGWLSRDDTRALFERLPDLYNAEITDAVVASLLHATAPSRRDRKLLIDVEEHGRQGPGELLDGEDLTRTVGCLASLVTVVLGSPEDPETASPGHTLRAAKDSLRTLPYRGFDYGFREDPLPEAEVLVRFLGDYGRLASETSTFDLGPSEMGAFVCCPPPGGRGYVLEINVLVIDGRLRMLWRYSSEFHGELEIRSLVDASLSWLRSLVDESRSKKTRDYSPSDFPLADLDQDKLDRLAAKLSKGGQQ